MEELDKQILEFVLSSKWIKDQDANLKLFKERYSIRIFVDIEDILSFGLIALKDYETSINHRLSYLTMLNYNIDKLINEYKRRKYEIEINDQQASSTRNSISS